MTQKNPETRSRLLQAAFAILVEEDGLLTLDAVAKRVGVSKGGLIHHFPTREALVEGVVEEVIRRFTVINGPMASSAGIDSRAGLEAYVDGSLRPDYRAEVANMARGLVRLLGAGCQKQTPFLEPWRRLFAWRLDRFRESRDAAGFARAAVVTLAVECFVLIDLFSLYQFTDEELDAIKRELLARFQP